jgi:hypothetical protein
VDKLNVVRLLRKHERNTPAAMPPCFERWCQRFDDVFTHKAQKREFRHYVGGLLGESERKNLFQIAENAVGVTYHRLHHCLDAVAHGGNPQDRAASLFNRSTLV